MYQHILVPVDGSKAAGVGLREATELAKIHNAQIRILHVVDYHPLAADAFGAYGIGLYTDQLMQAARDNGRAVLEQASVIAKQQGVTPEPILVDLPHAVSDAVIAQAREWPADLIVMGTHGRRGLRRLALGSDAEQVLRQSPVPLLLVRSE